MTVARITEISSVSTVSFQDAITQGVERANKTLKNLKGAWVKDQEVNIDNGKVTGYKVVLKVTFILTELQRAGIVEYARGALLKVLDRRAVEAKACECYRALSPSLG